MHLLHNVSPMSQSGISMVKCVNTFEKQVQNPVSAQAAKVNLYLFVVKMFFHQVTSLVDTDFSLKT